MRPETDLSRVLVRTMAGSPADNPTGRSYPTRKCFPTASRRSLTVRHAGPRCPPGHPLPRRIVAYCQCYYRWPSTVVSDRLTRARAFRSARPAWTDLHSIDMKLGLYTSRGQTTCMRRVASQDYEKVDMAQYLLLSKLGGCHVLSAPLMGELARIERQWRLI